ncbi:hypothetical protein [Caballeronia grimmiae]|uniref:Uncharacterized protein n=1 Tax=Caballeronia grimmiae TaxID=1071679 RepID=A0A069PBQ1_9BURK|nr:hypothetical protein [Caballeronia grimmiae]KDR34711.1 hypothetical protein BG57_03775 [Caballeronia grimmiae]GGD63541.1 hypothetical protein GCM10010985_16960 [Caballeronia grimmiae]
MPIASNYTTPSTWAVATYHVVQQLTLDYVSGQCTATVGSFLSKEAKDAGKFTIYTQQIVLEGLPAANADPKAYAEGVLVEAQPADVTSPPYANRYAFAGGTIVE